MTTNCLYARAIRGRSGPTSGTFCRMAGVNKPVTIKKCSACDDRTPRKNLAKHDHAVRRAGKGRARLPAWMPRKENDACHDPSIPSPTQTKPR